MSVRPASSRIEAAVTTANQAADLDGDGTISTSEAAQTDWVGGTNCNHGGYVSTVAQGTEDDSDANETDADAPTECEASLRRWKGRPKLPSR